MTDSVTDIIGRLARRAPGVSEATIQADVRNLILRAGLNLVDDQLEDVNLEAPTGDGTRRRIDVEVSTTVIEVKKNLDKLQQLEEAETQLAGYVHRRVKETGARFYGILTDGKRWRLYVPEVGQDEGLSYVTEVTLNAAANEHKLLDWLGSILSRVDNVYPTPDRLMQVLGATSPTYAADHATLQNLYESAGDIPEVQLKRELWQKLLVTAFGSSFEGSIDLFVDHSLLVLTAEAIAHAVLGFDISSSGSLTPDALASGQNFTEAGIHGVVESDFFDWPLKVEGGQEFIAALAHRLSRFTWQQVDHDVLKHVYESVVAPETRKELGEYYTPDWLAERMLSELAYDPLSNKILDASCGSGTFIFHAVRNYLETAEDAGKSSGQAIEGVVSHVYGMDIHPVAVALARVTYLLAIGTDRLNASPRPVFSVPVYIGDSVQWEQSTHLFADADSITIPTSGSHLLGHDEGLLFDDALVIPTSVMQDTQKFETVITRISKQVTDYEPRTKKGETRKKEVTNNSELVNYFKQDINAVLKTYELTPQEVDALVTTAVRMYELELHGRNHVWSYYIRNLVRPVWLSMPENRVDIVVGNPPWLRYALMNEWMKKKFTEHSKDHNLISGRLGVSGRDLSTLFVVRACELYLKPKGSFAYVMPHSSLTRKSSAGFRTGKWALRPNEQRAIAYGHFNQVWDLNEAPTGFPITSGAIFGTIDTSSPKQMPQQILKWRGKFKPASQPWSSVSQKLSVSLETFAQVTSEDLPLSPYSKRFRQGAILVPRRLIWAVERNAGPLGTPGGTLPLESRVTNGDDKQWRTEPIQANVAPCFVLDGYLGEHLLPYRTLPPGKVVLPLNRGELISSEQAALEPELASWWNRAEQLWKANKKAGTKESLAQRIDFHDQLSAQLRGGRDGYFVAYPKSGTTIAAAIITNPGSAVIDHTAYWARASSLSEARYLCGILNSRCLLDRIKPLQADGLFGKRHIDKYVFAVPFPEFDSSDVHHVQLVDLVDEAEDMAASTDLSAAKTFQQKRKLIRNTLADSGLGARVEELVSIILPEVVVTADIPT